MKTKLQLSVALALLALALAVPGLRAASATPPDRMTYQGFLVDANGVALGNTQPVNHTVEFRIYDASTGGTTKWGEVQTVTVDKGYFSVLLGDGSVLGGVPNGPLSGVFQGADASDRFISVKVSSLAGSSEILPRLRLVTSPYAYMANSLPPGSITNGLFAAASITGDKLATNTLTAANFSTNVGLWTANGTNISRTVGFVGVGNATPLTRLDVGGPAGVPSSNGYSGALRVFDTSGGGVGLQLGQYSTSPFASFIQSQRPSDNSVWGLSLNPLGGNVGVGTANPGTRLDVRNSSFAGGGDCIAFGSQNYVMGRMGEDTAILGNNVYLNNVRGVIDGSLDFRLGGASQMTIRGNGSGANVGIGTTSPTTLLDVRGGVSINGAKTGGGVLEVYGVPGGQYCRGATMSQFTPTGVNTGIGGCPSCCPVSDISIYAQNGVWASVYYAVSDERTKIIKGQSDAVADLDVLNRIRVTDFTYIDTLSKGDGQHKKVIAQELEKLLPQAVRKSTEAVPDIYKLTTHQDGWVQLKTSLKVGERVRLIGEKEEGVHEVLEVKDGAFRTAFKPATEKVFVFGREVNDFRTVDYEAISMLNVSATQELARKVKAQEEELTELRAELGKLRGERKSLAETVSNLEASFARLEKAMSKQAGVIEAKATSGDVSGASK